MLPVIPPPSSSSSEFLLFLALSSGPSCQQHSIGPLSLRLTVIVEKGTPLPWKKKTPSGCQCAGRASGQYLTGDSSCVSANHIETGRVRGDMLHLCPAQVFPCYTPGYQRVFALRWPSPTGPSPQDNGAVWRGQGGLCDSAHPDALHISTSSAAPRRCITATVWQSEPLWFFPPQRGSNQMIVQMIVCGYGLGLFTFFCFAILSEYMVKLQLLGSQFPGRVVTHCFPKQLACCLCFRKTNAFQLYHYQVGFTWEEHMVCFSYSSVV